MIMLDGTTHRVPYGRYPNGGHKKGQGFPYNVLDISMTIFMESEPSRCSNAMFVVHAFTIRFFVIVAKELFLKEKFPSFQIGMNVISESLSWSFRIVELEWFLGIDDGLFASFELNVRTELLISFDFKAMIEFNYKSRTYGFVKSEKSLEAYSLKEWKHIVFRNERWINYSSFMEEALFKSATKWRRKRNGVGVNLAGSGDRVRDNGIVNRDVIKVDVGLVLGRVRLTDPGKVDPCTFMVDPSIAFSANDPTKLMVLVPLVDALPLSNPRPTLKLDDF
ncbi:hypothetical protein Tco_0151949 [Tanacetum coccineum]